MSLDKLRNKIEKTIVLAIIAEALRLGYSISVDNGDEDYEINRSTDHAAIVRACALCDEDYIMFHSPSDRWRVGFVFIIYGEGATCITDYTDNDALKAILKPAQAIVDAALA